MEREEIKVCILRVGGTNCDAETKRSFEALGVRAETKHLNELAKDRNIMKYNALVFPGGFSYGDYVRAGALWAKILLARLGKELRVFVDENRPILGICNGFQVLVEAGLLPGFEKMSAHPQAALTINEPPGYNCRWINVKHENSGKCIFTRNIPKGTVLKVPVAHAEGRFIFPKENEKRFLERLQENDQLVFRYCRKNGEYAENSFPTNPNGSFSDIAGICDSSGTIFGLMPHPERAFYWWQQPDWTRRREMSEFGDGELVFENLINYLERQN
jgi:phosphoribosylformylglycinamidine synthase I